MRSENPPKDVSLADNIVLSPSGVLAKVFRSVTMRMGQGEHKMTLGTAQVTHITQTLGETHVIHNTKYRSEVLLGMKTTVSTVKNSAWKSANPHVEVQVEALADLGASSSIISLTQ